MNQRRVLPLASREYVWRKALPGLLHAQRSKRRISTNPRSGPTVLNLPDSHAESCRYLALGKTANRTILSPETQDSLVTASADRTPHQQISKVVAPRDAEQSQTLPASMSLVDNHNHILLAKISEMIASAKANNVSELSITEHVSQFRELRESIKFGSLHPSGRIFDNLKEYRDEFGKIDLDTVSKMKINRGLEVDFSPRFEKSIADFVNQERWDILLCSIHEFENGKDIERNARGIVDPDSAHELWRDYVRLQRLALESDFVPFKILAHPVRMSRSSKAVPHELDDLLLDLAQVARRRDKALELNGRDLDYAPELVRRLALACSKADCRVSLGSDAHHPIEVFRNMSIARSLTEEFNLKIDQRDHGQN